MCVGFLSRVAGCKERFHDLLVERTIGKQAFRGFAESLLLLLANPGEIVTGYYVMG
jgi:hypothetical protein